MLSTEKQELVGFIDGYAPYFEDIADKVWENPELSLKEFKSAALYCEELEKLDCPVKARRQIDVAIDELFGNIARYAYSPDVGKATVRFSVEEDPLEVTITFIDNGIPFNPLEKSNPDTHLSAEERPIGGLGIFLVKKINGSG